MGGAPLWAVLGRHAVTHAAGVGANTRPRPRIVAGHYNPRTDELRISRDHLTTSALNKRLALEQLVAVVRAVRGRPGSGGGGGGGLKAVREAPPTEGFCVWAERVDGYSVGIPRHRRGAWGSDAASAHCW